MQGIVTDVAFDGMSRDEVCVNGGDFIPGRIVDTGKVTFTMKLTGPVDVSDVSMLSGNVEIVPVGKAGDDWFRISQTASKSNCIVDDGQRRRARDAERGIVREETEAIIADMIQPPDEVRGDAATRPTRSLRERVFLPDLGALFSPNQWLAMAYAAGLLGLVQAGFWIVRWV